MSSLNKCNTIQLSWSWMDNSHLFRSMSFGCPIPEIRLFQMLILNLQGQCHVGSQGARSYSLPSIKFIHFSFYINETNNSCDTAISKFDLEKSKVKAMSEVKGQGHIVARANPSLKTTPFRGFWTRKQSFFNRNGANEHISVYSVQAGRSFQWKEMWTSSFTPWRETTVFQNMGLVNGRLLFPTGEKPCSHNVHMEQSSRQHYRNGQGNPCPYPT